ncbi:MAG: cytochrome b/b6 domain-containing protein [Woeseia sp.]
MNADHFQPTGTAETLVTRAVWDRTTRIFHWINVLCVLALATLGLAILNEKAFGVSADGKILLKTLHVYVGYVFVLNLVWRIVWAFIGNRHARWSALLPFRKGYGTELRGYLQALRSGESRSYLGHNPLGRLMILLLLVLLLSQAMTGLVLAGTDLYMPPYGGAIAQWVTEGDEALLSQLRPGSQDYVVQDAYKEMRAFRKPIATVHMYVFYVLAAAIFLHVVGVIVAEVRERGGLVSAMISGHKVVKDVPFDEDPQTKE